MVAYEQIRKGVVTYVQKELAPLTPKAMSFALVAFAPMVVEAKMKQFFDSGVFDGTPLIDGKSIDIDEAVRLYKNASEGGWPIELFGFTLKESDIDKVYRYIKEAQ